MEFRAPSFKEDHNEDDEVTLYLVDGIRNIPWSWERFSMPLLSIVFSPALEVVANTIRQVKYI